MLLCDSTRLIWLKVIKKTENLFVRIGISEMTLKKATNTKNTELK